MSHFVVLVSAKNEEELESRLAPFDENLDVEFCVIAQADGVETQAKKIIKELDAEDDLRERYQTMLENGEGESILCDWHGACRNPDTGNWGYWHNPDAKWDWWMIGGRWTGLLASDYDPTQDPANREICGICKGTGDRDGWVYYELDENGERVRRFKDAWAEEMNGCNSCKGTGVVTKWPTQYKSFEGDTVLVGHVDWQGLKDKSDGDAITFAVVTEEGQWVERGNMGWWAIVTNEDEGYPEWFWQYVEQLPKDQRLWVVDCHI